MLYSFCLQAYFLYRDLFWYLVVRCLHLHAFSTLKHTKRMPNRHLLPSICVFQLIDHAAIYQWSHKLYGLQYNNLRMAEQIFMTFAMDVMPLQAKEIEEICSKAKVTRTLISSNCKHNMKWAKNGTHDKSVDLGPWHLLFRLLRLVPERFKSGSEWLCSVDTRVLWRLIEIKWAIQIANGVTGICCCICISSVLLLFPALKLCSKCLCPSVILCL